MSGEYIADIVIGKNDLTDHEITDIYSKVKYTYAVYANTNRVMIQYSDDESLAKEQRLALAHLAPLRGEINGLIDGWRSSWFAENRSRARRFDRRTADALVVALQGDQASAETVLTAIKADIADERASLGRAQYITIAALSALIIFVLFWILTPSKLVVADVSRLELFILNNHLWLSTGVGSLGALFSIALGIKGRNIQTDLRMRDNIVDAVLRVIIGAISAFILFSLIKSRVVTFSMGGTPVLLTGENTVTVEMAQHISIVAAFLAGFSERLVGNFLGNIALDSPQAPAPTTDRADKKDQPTKAGADEKNPLGKPAAADPDALKKDIATADDARSVDACLCDTHLDDDQLTTDDELPEASGGVEQKP